MDIISAFGLGSAAGLNAYIPMLIVGLMDRYTSFVTLPPGWTWLSDGWMLGIVAVLLAIEIVADKIPVVDSINDVLQTVIRPASGGIVFASGFGPDSQVITDSATVFSGGRWVMFIVGAVVALVIHLMKSSARPVANLATAGFAAPVVSAGEDATSLALSLTAILAPIIALFLSAVAIAFLTWLLLRRRTRRQPLEQMDF